MNLEDQGSLGSAGSHWESTHARSAVKQYFLNYVLNPILFNQI